ncbi:MAG: tRNA 4-thiouridine(8) synthase ThiI [[Eubacterium] brachy]|nr:tRNA 4-thiouridine(8) synthase ThiI [[Eubacterium] brachy]
MNRHLFIVRFGETALKGKNKSYFEKKLVDRVKKILRKFSGVDVYREEGLVFVSANSENSQEELVGEISKVFGISSISPAVETNPNMEDIYETAVNFMMNLIEKESVRTFKVEAKRADKNFPVKSPEIARLVGGEVLKGCKVLKVDVRNPQVCLHVDVRRDKAYIYRKKIQGYGGLPLGTNGKGMLLLSGGIDSPVAGWMMAKRGMGIEAIHFHSYPYTSRRAQEKVEELARQISIYCGDFKLHIVNLLPVQEEIIKTCPEEETTILVRRFMMKIAEKVGEQTGAKTLITGESLGQVASQTTESIVCTDQSVAMPVLRPLIAMDKVDIMDVAKKIGTYETSILPYEDCCTVFLPKHPVTRPKLESILHSEEKLNVDKLVAEAMKNVQIKNITSVE